MTQLAEQGVAVANAGLFGVNGHAPRVDPTQIAALRRDGFLVVRDVSPPEELASLRVVYDRMFAERRGWETGDMFDMVGNDDPEAEPGIPQLLWPSRYEPALGDTTLAANARRIAEQILGFSVEKMNEHATLKPPKVGAATPWHQDDAFDRKGSGFLESISIWVPLQDVTLESGCMQYIRGSNLGPLYPHRSPGGDPRISGLESVEAPDLANCVAVPIRAGDAVIHLSRTLHSAGANTSDQPRRAYVLGYAVKARRHGFLTRDYPWNLEKQTYREKRELAALSPLKRTILRFRRYLRTRKF